MYSYFKGEKSDISKPKLVNAFKAACCDYLTFDNNFSFEGIVSLCDKLLGSDEAQNLRNFYNTTILPLKKL